MVTAQSANNPKNASGEAPKGLCPVRFFALPTPSRTTLSRTKAITRMWRQPCSLQNRPLPRKKHTSALTIGTASPLTRKVTSRTRTPCPACNQRGGDRDRRRRTAHLHLDEPRRPNRNPRIHSGSSYRTRRHFRLHRPGTYPTTLTVPRPVRRVHRPPQHQRRYAWLPGRHATARCILSNNHVLAAVNAASPGDAIEQPGPSDQTQAQSGRRIATLTDYEPILFGASTNHIDAAIAALDDPTLVTPGIMAIGTHANPPIAAHIDQSVAKHGRTTGLTFGTVVDTSFDGNCQCRSNFPGSAEVKFPTVVENVGGQPLSDEVFSGRVERIFCAWPGLEGSHGEARA